MSQVLKLVLIALFLAVGTVLHAVVPSFPMKPDLLLSMMFLTIFLFSDRRNFIVIGLVAGLLSGLTSTMPGGFLPNVIDKIITTAVIFAIYSAIRTLVPKFISAIVLTALGTILSGTVFLSALSVLASLPPNMSFVGLFLAIVLPAAAINTVLMIIIYPIIERIMRNSFSNNKAMKKVS
ncbi:MAG: tryptophan transporter [Tuberibacillus sp.]